MISLLNSYKVQSKTKSKAFGTDKDLQSHVITRLRGLRQAKAGLRLRFAYNLLLAGAASAISFRPEMIARHVMLPREGYNTLKTK